MKTIIKKMSAIGIIAVAVSGSLASANETTQDAWTWPDNLSNIDAICGQTHGRLNTSWRYDSQGSKWGQLWVCDTEDFLLVCQDEVCQATYKEESIASMENSGR